MSLNVADKNLRNGNVKPELSYWYPSETFGFRDISR